MPPTDPVPEDALGCALLALARNAIDRRLSGIEQNFLQVPDLPALDQPAATFVTLTRAGDLRGCIGSLEAYRPLRDDVQENALAAAFRDPRFPPLTATEWPDIQVEVSLLSTPQALSVRDEADLLTQLCPGRDGLILQEGSRRATFLPQVWEQLPEPKQFLSHLMQKAGRPANYWSPTLRFERYGVKKWPAN